MGCVQATAAKEQEELLLEEVCKTLASAIAISIHGLSMYSPLSMRSKSGGEA